MVEDAQGREARANHRSLIAARVFSAKCRDCLAGIEGSGDFTRYNVRPAVEGTVQSVTKLTGTYKLPTASASR